MQFSDSVQVSYSFLCGRFPRVYTWHIRKNFLNQMGINNITTMKHGFRKKAYNQPTNGFNEASIFFVSDVQVCYM